MPPRNDLLNPISPQAPAGVYLRHDEIWDRIKEARREDDDAPQGDWKRERKTADWPLTIKLAGDALAAKSKDLQLAAWLTEALLRREGIHGLSEGLDLQRGLIENFWDGLFPEIEDGDLEFRAAPLQWIGDRLGPVVKTVPLTAGKIDWFRYRESRTVGTEEEAAESSEKRERRQEAIQEGKLAPEVFDKDFNQTPKAFYVELESSYQAALESLSKLAAVCDERFGEVSPSFRPLQQSLEEVAQTVHAFLVKKRETEPDEQPAPPPPTAPVIEEAPAAPVLVAGTAAAPAPAPVPVAAVLHDPVAQIVAACRSLRQHDPYSPAPYLILRGLRWGELRAGGASIDPAMLAAPPSEIRQALKRQALESNWSEVLETAETAMAMECGRGWLDLQRYIGRACGELGSYYDPIRNAVISELRALLADYPQLPGLTLMDDTPTANPETLAWIKEHVAPSAAASEPAPVPEPMNHRAPEAPPEDSAPDPFELAFQAARSGRAQDGIELLMREMMQEPSGRGRFQRKIQLAQLCLSTGNEAIALPILQEAAEEIERRKLEEWETRELVAHPLAMLYRCLEKCDGAKADRQKLYGLICRLDPVEAMQISR
jgi:type VI secretion system protein ImpA